MFVICQRSMTESLQYVSVMSVVSLVLSWGWIKCQNRRYNVRIHPYYLSPWTEEIKAHWQACLCIFYCNAAALFSMTVGALMDWTHMDRRVHLYAHRPHPAPHRFIQTDQSVHAFATRATLSLLILARDSGVIDRHAAAWGEWWALLVHIWSPQLLRRVTWCRVIGKPRINCQTDQDDTAGYWLSCVTEI